MFSGSERKREIDIETDDKYSKEYVEEQEESEDRDQVESEDIRVLSGKSVIDIKTEDKYHEE